MLLSRSEYDVIKLRRKGTCSLHEDMAMFSGSFVNSVKELLCLLPLEDEKLLHVFNRTWSFLSVVSPRIFMYITH